ncbi:MAG: pyruvate kinase [Chloroflexota bacterium]|nr:pyruvate kinase [Chloroflexota bacterium]
MIPRLDISKKTKVICTIGPASESDQMIEKLALAGMNVARLNFSHGTHEQHAARIETVRRVSSRLGLPLAVLQDLPGPKIRTGRLQKGKVLLKAGEQLILTNQNIVGDEHRISVTLLSLPEDVNPGGTVFLSDGSIKLEVLDTTESEVRCRIVTGGVLTPRKGMNIPGVRLSMSAITDDDLKHLQFGLKHGVDFVALSFIGEAADVVKAKQFLQSRGATVPLIAKIEKREAVDNVNEIIAAADGIMVARGDLGVEIPLRRVPLVQKEIISRCNRVGKPVVVATQMLESMVHSPYPTRAEVSDVANAILDGADAVMLSEETAAGAYPEKATSMMAKVATEAGAALPYRHILSEKVTTLVPQTDDAISYAACQIAEQLGAVAIIACTSSGSTAQRVAKYRPKAPILAITSRGDIVRRLALYWGVYPRKVAQYTTVEEVFKQGAQLAVKLGLARTGDLLVITAGVPFGTPGSTNMLKVQKIA